MPKFTDRLQHAWNAFMNKDPTVVYRDIGAGFSYRPDRPRLHRGNERTIVTAIINRIAMDVATAEVRHVRLDENERYLEEIHSGLDNCLTLDANIDQTGRAFLQDIVMSMLDEGCVAIVPTETDVSPDKTASYDIVSMRTAKILEWYPKHVRVKLYNDKTGRQEEIILSKSMVAVIENPLYAVMNEPNSTLQRLIRKLNILDVIDEQNGAGKLDLIIQLPYVIKSPARREQAEARRKDIEMQLAGSKYGIAYTDGTERITQLNRSVDNQLMNQIEYLTSMLYSQLGITAEIMNGTANEDAMNNYYARIVEPILSAIVDGMKRTYLTKTARTRGQSIMFFLDPFKFVPTTRLADIADRFTRNEIMSSNEFRQVIGLKPSNDPKADELRNSNMPVQDTQLPMDQQLQNEGENLEEEVPDDPEAQEADLDDLDAQLDELLKELEHSDESDALIHYASPYYDPVKAHEYYMKNRELKGRKSTAGLTDEGREAAQYVKNRLTAERKQKVEASKNRMNTGINRSKAKMNSAIAQNREYQTSTLKSRKDALNATIKANSEATKTKVERERAQVNTEIETHKAQTQSRIDNLRERLKSMSKEDKALFKEDIAEQIANLRNANNAKRKQLRDAYSTKAKSIRSANSAESKSLREKYKTDSDTLRGNTKTSNETSRAKHKTTSTTFRNAHKSNVAKYKQEADSKYESELEKIRSEYTKPKKRK